jgi:diguanylate cyclase (GGDEF)-like protein/PAS domain S-box-containing protein
MPNKKSPNQPFSQNQLDFIVKLALSKIDETVYIIDESGIFLYVNSTGCSVLGYSEAEILSMSVWNIDPNISAEIFKTLWEAIVQRKNGFFETTHQKKDGSNFPVEISGNYFEYEGVGYVMSIARDITERKNHLSQIERILFAINHTDQAILIAKGEHGEVPVFTFANDKACEMLEYTYDELCNGMGPFLIDMEHSHQRSKLIEEQKSARFETSFKTKSDKVIPVEVSVTLYTQDEEQYGIILVKELSLLKQHEKTTQNLVENIPGFAYILEYNIHNKEEKFSYLCNTVAKFFGVSASEIRDDISCFYNQIDKDTLQSYKTALIDSACTLMPINTLLHIHHPVQGELWLEAHATPQSNTDGTIFWYGVMIDRTKRQEMEMALASQERNFHSLVENSPDNIIRWDLNGNYLYINPTYERTFGVLLSEVIGRSIPDTQMEVKAAVKRVCKTGEGESVRQEISTQESNVNFFHINIVPERDQAGKIVSILGVGRDMSEIYRLQDEMAYKEKQYRTLAENSLDVIIRYNLAGERVYINPMGEKLFGRKASDIIGKKATDYSPIPSEVAFMEKFYEVIRTGNPIETETEFTIPDGTKGWGHMRIIPEYDNEKNIISILTIGRDITKLKNQEKELLKRGERLKEAQEISLLGSWNWDIVANRVEWSHMAYEIYTPDNYPAEPSFVDFTASLHPEDADRVIAAVYSSFENDTPFDIEHRVVSISKGVRTVHAHGKVFRDDNGTPIRMMGTVQDITERKEIAKKMEYLAHHDMLIGLPNRILSQQKTEQAIEKVKLTQNKVGLLYIDLDGFKAINDTLGHTVGDAVLKKVAERIIENIRPNDILCRQGGDEFLLIMPDITFAKEVKFLSDKLIKLFDQTFEVQGHLLTTGASIGIALYPDHGDNFETLLKNADIAMYHAKNNGKNGYSFYNQQLNHHQIGVFKLQNDLKSALQHNEFLLHYQPQIDLKSQQVIGAEALIRWHHPQMGIIPPINFISIAESSGLIVQIGEWVIREACHQAAKWKNMGVTITVAVNISSIQFKRGDLEKIVKSAIADANIDPHCLELELTESILMHDTDNTLQTVRNLKAFGVQLSIDDFGTGYSSLAYLKRFVVDKLKIDQSFVRDIVSDQEDAIIVRTIIQMAKSLNLKTIAEGVENQDVLKIIESFGCEEVQGYHFDKPLSPDEFEKKYVYTQ